MDRERHNEICRKSYRKIHGLKPKLTPAQRFEKLIAKQEVTNNWLLSGCWLWQGAVNRLGYGKVKVERKHLTAHRWSWMLHHGPIPDGLYVLHRCDVPGCVNPSHLFLGTAKDNNIDMWLKGRRGAMRGGSRPGESSACVKFMDADIARMREVRLFHIGPTTEISKYFGINNSYLSAILRDKSRRAHHV